MVKFVLNHCALTWSEYKPVLKYFKCGLNTEKKKMCSGGEADKFMVEKHLHRYVT